MDFKAAIAALKKLDADNIDELVSSIEGHVSKLEEKSYDTIGESRKNGSKARALQAVVEAIAKLVGVTGDDLESALEPKVKELVDSSKTAQTKVTELETRATTAESKVKDLESVTKLSEVAAKVGADAKVLKRLLGDKVSEMTIDGDAVKLGDKSLREFVEADEELKGFVPALFPTQQKQEKSPPKLPSGSPNGGAGKDDRPSRSYLDSVYGKTADQLVGKTDK
ncbi:MAG TPA: hypothetical protein V6D10_07160 [Trichocoleus sp.]|jgi:vacuolar-type H+-ATPase subunit I/STV1